MYATPTPHPATIHHAPSWLGPVLVALAAIVLIGLALVAMEVVDLRLLFAPTVDFTPSTQMMERQFQIEHQGDILGAGTTQLQQFFVIEHQADMQ